MKRFVVTPSRCTGCRTCEIACAFSHPIDGAPGRSAIRAFGLDAPNRGVPVVCLQCDSAACVLVCPSGALERDGKTAAIMVRHQKCILCRSCVYACPFGNISFHEQARQVFKCDLCEGAPRCAMFCPTRALEYVF